ncbi:MAG: IS1 family transposase [Nitrosomonas sp.]|nr:IS1 family transposase [Nitrosomonas sp.]
MKSKTFKELLVELDKLTPHQKKQIEEQLQHHTDIQTVFTLIEKRMDTESSCPKCGSSEKIIRWESSAGLQRYRCDKCKATFNVQMGTPLARLRHKEKWLSYTQQMADNRSIRKSAEACLVHRNTSFRWRHRFLELSDTQKTTHLTGITEADETFFLESLKGKKREMKRAARKRGSKASKRGLSFEQIPVLICRD